MKINDVNMGRLSQNQLLVRGVDVRAHFRGPDPAPKQGAAPVAAQPVTAPSGRHVASLGVHRGYPERSLRWVAFGGSRDVWFCCWG